MVKSTGQKRYKGKLSINIKGFIYFIRKRVDFWVKDRAFRLAGLSLRAWKDTFTGIITHSEAVYRACRGISLNTAHHRASYKHIKGKA